jgi:hypothetical protein
MLGSRQTRPSDPTAWTLFGCLQLSTGMVPSPKPSRAYSCTCPLPAWSEQGWWPWPQYCSGPEHGK